VGQRCRRLAEVEPDQREALAADEQVRGPERHVTAAAAAHPQETGEVHARARGRGGIERAVGVHERGDRAAPGDLAEARDEEARAPRRQAADDLGDGPGNDHGTRKLNT